MNGALVVQLLVLLTALAAAVWGAMGLWAVLFPGNGGEWAVTAVYFAGVVNVPVGIALLVVSRLVKTGSPALRKAGMILAALALALPVAADIVWRFRMRG